MRLVVSIAAFLLGVTAHPATVQSTGTSLRRRAVDINRFRLQTSAEYVASAAVPPEEKFGAANADYVEVATQLVREIAAGAEFRLVDDHYVGTNGVAHVHFRQTVNGIDIDNTDFNVNVSVAVMPPLRVLMLILSCKIGRDGQVFSYGSSFYSGEMPESQTLPSDDSDPLRALRDVNDALGLSIATEDASVQAEGQEEYTITGTSGSVQDPNAKLVYFRTADDRLVLSWRVETDIYTNWLLSYANAADSKEILGVVDYSNDATYKV